MSGVSPPKGSILTLAAERRASQTEFKGAAHYVVSRAPSNPGILDKIPIERPTKLKRDSVTSDRLNLSSPRPTLLRSHSVGEEVTVSERPQLPRAHSLSFTEESFDMEKLRRLVYIARFAPHHIPSLQLSAGLSTCRQKPHEYARSSFKMPVRGTEKRAFVIYDLKELGRLASSYCPIDDAFKEQMRKDWAVVERMKTDHRKIIFALKDLTRLPANKTSYLHEAFSFQGGAPQKILVERIEGEVIDALDGKTQRVGYKISNGEVMVTIWGNPRGDVNDFSGSFQHIAWYGHYGKTGTPTRVEPELLIAILTSNIADH